MKKDLFILVGVLLLIAHMVVIMDDVQVVINDPNIDNKPTEVVKLVVDLRGTAPLTGEIGRRA